MQEFRLELRVEKAQVQCDAAITGVSIPLWRKPLGLLVGGPCKMASQ